MRTRTLEVVHGTNHKPVATEALLADLEALDIGGQLLIGYPVMASAEGCYAIDALIVSPEIGVLCFDLIEGPDPGDYDVRQDDDFNRLSARLFVHRELVTKRRLSVPINTVSYAPAIASQDRENHTLLNHETVCDWISGLSLSKELETLSTDIYLRTLSALQSITAIRRAGRSREILNKNSRGSRLQFLENSIATLDAMQSAAVIETVEGVQRIRGLAGSGKTIVLALKAAYLHAQHPDWRIVVTFNTRSLKGYFTKLINNFCIDQIGQEPNWDRVRIMNSWGASGPPDREGVYHEFCLQNDVPYYDFRSARNRYGWDGAFDGAVVEALDQVIDPKQPYDAVLVDEAQDLPPAFLRMCYRVLREPGHLVYAYDELQNLTNVGLPSPEEIFGSKNGKPRVSFDSERDHSRVRRDIILDICYRNSRPVLTTAHGLGFGIYRKPEHDGTTGLVQMFDQPRLWEDIGYRIRQGKLELGRKVALRRVTETSPRFLEDHSPPEDLVKFVEFDDEEAQAKWVACEIQQNLDRDELRPDDIMVINTEPISSRDKLSKIRAALDDKGIHSHLTGVDTNPDEFFQAGSITCTGIHRAKGNEVAMVYVVNANQSYGAGDGLSRIRNRLFTAITRSKAWVRVAGVGPKMQSLIKEYESLVEADFELQFRYPKASELKRLTIVHRDVSPSERRMLREQRQSVSQLVTALRKERVFLEDLDEVDVEALRAIFGGEPRLKENQD